MSDFFTVATANDIATLNNESDPSLDIPVAPIVPTAVVTTSDRDISRVRSVLDSMVNKLKVQIDTTEKVRS